MREIKMNDEFWGISEGCNDFIDGWHGPGREGFDDCISTETIIEAGNYRIEGSQLI
jgi:hypothetical protein